MRVPLGLGNGGAFRLGAVTVTAALLALPMARPATASTAGPDPTLCAMSTSRVVLPASLPVPACFDGSQLVMVNKFVFPIEVRTDHGGVPVVSPLADATIPAAVTSLMAPAADGLTPPEYRVTIAIPAQATTVTLSFPPQSLIEAYVWGEQLYNAVGLDPLIGIGQSLAGLLGELAAVTDHYRTCLLSADWLGSIGCATGYVGNITFALLRFGLKALTPGVIQAAYNLITTALETDQAAAGVRAWLDGVHQFAIPAAGTQSPGTGSPGSPSPSPGAPGPGPATVSLSQGRPAPAGYRYAVQLSGFPASADVTVTCYDSVSISGFYTFSLRTDTAGSASTQSQCYSGDGPDHWVTANGLESNHVQWGAAPPPPPPPPPATTPETVGGVTHTWTNYADAGGAPGPTVPPFTTVQISCKLTGFKVADGNPWWYRIASPGWNNNFYASADAFYNNGQTSGSLAGTPWVDNAVPNC